MSDRRALMGAVKTGGGGYSIDDIATASEPSGDIVITATTIAEDVFLRRPGITSVVADNATTINMQAFRKCSNLTSFTAKNATKLGSYWIAETSVSVLVFQKISNNTGFQNRFTTMNNKLHVVDLGGNNIQICNKDFESASALTTIILRRPTIVPMQNASAFNGSLFKSGGTGGTIYIPKVLYDELGTGSANDYKAATNWSTVDGYGTITWAQIEGSQYENYYADGTPIS